MSEEARKSRRQQEAEEDVLRLLLERTQGTKPAPGALVQEELALPPGEFAALISALKAKGWLRESDAELSLTPVGAKVARDLLDRHETAERFFKEVLGEPPVSAHAAAERLEHVISQRALQELKQALRRTQGAVPLSDLSLGDGGTVLALKDPGEKTFARLMGIGLSPGTRLKVLGKMPNGSMIIEINKGKVGIAEEIARAIFVRKERPDEDGHPHRPAELG